MKTQILASVLAFFALTLHAQQDFRFGSNQSPEGRVVTVDRYGIKFDNHHAIPVMGELHYARVPQRDWRREVRKMKAGGITVLSTYVFWIHHEAEEGKWDWSGNKDLHRFLQICKEEGMPVVLRVGPFCHGEVYQGGFPVWLVEKTKGGYLEDGKVMPSFKLRSEAPAFLAATQRLYSNIYAQVSDMLWKDGGPIIGMQIENECRGPWSYYKRLKNMAVAIGFDVPFYTRTDWPKLNGKEEFGQLLPLYGDYADGFWDRVLTDMPGDYPKAFIMKDSRLSTVIATETFTKDELQEGADGGKSSEGQQVYPYLTCELGGGMMPSYHRRINITGREAMPLAVCKLGSGSNLPGYYMYHGGTNPYSPLHTMAECQASPVTNYNDMPHMTYDFQCPLGEMGQLNEVAFHETRWLHQFLADWGEQLSTMDVDTLSDQYARRGCFEFRNTYVRILHEDGVASVTPCGMEWEGLRISSQSVQPFAKTADGLYFITVRGQKPVLEVDGKKYVPKLDRPIEVKGKKMMVLSPEKAMTAYVIDGQMCYAKHGGVLYKGEGGTIQEEVWKVTDEVAIKADRVQAEKGLREIKMGSQKVAEQPAETDFSNAAVWSIGLSAVSGPSIKRDGMMTMDLRPSAFEEPDDYFLRINYRGDVARLYVDGQLVEDNFWNGKPMLVRLSDLVDGRGNPRRVELRILPLGKQYPIYLQKEQRAVLDAASGDYLLHLDGIEVVHRDTQECEK